jgi:hypothetical protein
MRHVSRLILAGVLAFGLSLPMTSAEAHRTSWRTASSFGLTASGGEAALGTISSPKAQCVSGRKVKLFMVRAGRDRLIGVDRRSGQPSGNGDGYWVVEANLRPGKRYYARVVRKNLGNGNHRHICKAYQTSRVTYSG